MNVIAMEHMKKTDRILDDLKQRKNAAHERGDKIACGYLTSEWWELWNYRCGMEKMVELLEVTT